MSIVMPADNIATLCTNNSRLNPDNMVVLLTWADWDTCAWVVRIDEVESGLTLEDISGGSNALELLWIGQRLVWARGCDT